MGIIVGKKRKESVYLKTVKINYSNWKRWKIQSPSKALKEQTQFIYSVLTQGVWDNTKYQAYV